MPTPNDAATLSITDGVSLFVHTRITHGTNDTPLHMQHRQQTRQRHHRHPRRRTRLRSRPVAPLIDPGEQFPWNNLLSSIRKAVAPHHLKERLLDLMGTTALGPRIEGANGCGELR